MEINGLHKSDVEMAKWMTGEIDQVEEDTSNDIDEVCFIATFC